MPEKRFVAATHPSRLPMGSSDPAENPDFIKTSQSVRPVEINASTKRMCNDNLCVFPAIAASQLGKIKGLEAKTMKLFNLYPHRVQTNFEYFTGIELTDLPNVEKFCSCAIRVFSEELNDETNQIQ